MTDHHLLVEAPHTARLPRLLWVIIVLGVAAGLTSVVVSSRSAGRLTKAAEEAAARGAAQSEANGRLLDGLRRTQDCTVALLLIVPEDRHALTDADLARICPPVEQFPTTTTTTATTAPRSAATTRPAATAVRPSPATTATSSTTSAPRPTTTTTGTTAPPTTTTTSCLAGLVVGCLGRP